MTKKDERIREEFANILAREARTQEDGVARIIAAKLLALGKTYSRLQEMNCNGVGSDNPYEDAKAFAARQEKFEKWVANREKQVEARVTTLCKQLGEGFEAVFSGDPRGNTIKLKVPSGYANDWAHEGVSVPTS